ncbi:hypothetical protein A8924_4042 [Saccharopolyspora erythraea NRRL 2338]|uniref:hypothetical protein n=1 Tax=Saccharopolyspora erythraea TaxID=1836 RepID=UPI000C00104C|nr:hypothetical protein [Saccharopolyspora erythraea]PFG96633.1 hypothetical protein A8924_4042 [Saccharopolyspora erythraea NRRL 2338]QRK93114.1 hypothetical protein JQX30_18635 [Saccharopolyspora erythraea]
MNDHQVPVVLVEVADSVWTPGAVRLACRQASPGGVVVLAVTRAGWPVISTDAVVVARRADRVAAEHARVLAQVWPVAAPEAARHGLRVLVVRVRWWPPAGSHWYAARRRAALRRAARCCRAQAVVGDPGAMPDMPAPTPGRHGLPVRGEAGRRR